MQILRRWNMQIQKFDHIDCAWCGKRKIISSLKRDWTYKTSNLKHGYIYFCSYGCYRQWMKKYRQPNKEED